MALVNMLVTFLQSEPDETAPLGALKLLGLIGNTAEDEGGRRWLPWCKARTGRIVVDQNRSVRA
jgi:hypothetical protein